MQIIKFVLMLLLALLCVFLGLAFLTHNSVEVAVDLLFVSPQQTKLAYWLLGFFIIGGFSGLLASMPLVMREKAARIRLERRMKNNSKIISGYTN